MVWVSAAPSLRMPGLLASAEEEVIAVQSCAWQSQQSRDLPGNEVSSSFL